MITFRSDDNPNYAYYGYETAGHYYLYGICPTDYISHSPEKSHLPFLDWCKLKYPRLHSVQTTELEEGYFYLRIWRGVCSPLSDLASSQTVTNSVVACSLLVSKLLNIFSCVQPDAQNTNTYGHEIRDLLLLACMEVESAFAAVLKVNKYQGPSRLSTNDYVKLREAMWLSNYKIKLLSYPDFPEFAPFENWDKSKPSQSLKWWDAYNSIKHDRENNFSLSTLENAIHAVGAAVVMIQAQFGDVMQDSYIGVNIASEFRVDFLTPPPDKEFYIPSPTGIWIAPPYKF